MRLAKPSSTLLRTRRPSLDHQLKEDSVAKATEDYVKHLVAWASVSYTLGFGIVTLRTWRLGLPVIELLHPIYVWAGLPVLVVLFFSRRITTMCLRAGDRAAMDIRQGWAQARYPAIRNEFAVIEYMQAAARALPLSLGGAAPIPAIVRLFSLTEILTAERSKDRVTFDRSVRRFRCIAGIVRVINAAQSIAGIVFALIYLVSILATYIVTLYPRIRQSLGGEKPVTAQMVVEQSAIPPSLVSPPQAPGTTVGEKATTLLSVKLPYLTSSAYYVETLSGARASIKSDTVKSIIWRPVAISSAHQLKRPTSSMMP